MNDAKIKQVWTWDRCGTRQKAHRVIMSLSYIRDCVFVPFKASVFCISVLAESEDSSISELVTHSIIDSVRISLKTKEENNKGNDKDI